MCLYNLFIASVLFNFFLIALGLYCCTLLSLVVVSRGYSEAQAVGNRLSTCGSQALELTQAQ